MKLPYGFDDESWMQPFFAIARSLRDLGNAGASSPMGAIENLSKQIKEGSERMASALENIADAIKEGKS